MRETVFRSVELGELEVLRAREQRLRRDAPDVDAGAAERLSISTQTVVSPSCAARMAAT